MSKINKKRLIALGLSITLASLWLFRPYEKATSQMVDPRLTALEVSYQKINIHSFGDGGSIGLEIIDRNGKALAFCLPAPMDEPSLTFNKLFIGSLYYTEGGSSEVLNAHHTKLRLAEILRSQSSVDADNDVLVYRLSGRWRDLLRYIIREYVLHSYDR